ncbi:MAG: hypothetical protein K5871_12160 [Lachnospiraceae bacterium]|nr:hypothetical protein [Lachnospiraceae bacterium]
MKKRTGDKLNKYTDILCDAALMIMLALSVMGLALISYYAATGTYLFRRVGAESAYITDSFLKQGIVFALFAAAVLILGHLWEKHCKTEDSASDLILIICSVLSFVIGIIYLKDHPYYMDGDQINTFYAAVYASEKGSAIQYAMFQPGGYIGIYPQQKGLVFFYLILHGLFGEKLYTAMQYIHLLYPQMILHAGYHALKEEKISAFGRSIYCILILTCLPLYLYIPYMYGDLGSIAFSFCFALFLIRFLNSGKKLDLALMSLFGSIALLLRMQIWILLIAACIVLFLEFVRKKKILLLIACAMIVLVPYLSDLAIDTYFEKVSGYEDVDGIPAACWLAMGLQETNGNPGVYNRYNQGTFGDCGFDAEKASEIAMLDFHESLDNFREDHEYAKWFFETKLRQEWTAPDMEGFTMTSIWDALSGTDPSEAPEWLYELYWGKYYDKVINIANRYQTIIYLSAFILAAFELIFFRKKKNLSHLVQLCLIYFLGGFIFFTLWENMSRYMLPFFMSLVWLVPFMTDDLMTIKDLFKGRKSPKH